VSCAHDEHPLKKQQQLPAVHSTCWLSIPAGWKIPQLYPFMCDFVPGKMLVFHCHGLIATGYTGTPQASGNLKHAWVRFAALTQSPS